MVYIRKIEKLTYQNENGESIEFSRNSVYFPTKITGLSNISNVTYSIYSMGQDGISFLGNRIEPREIQIIGTITERDKEKSIELRRQMGRILNPHLEGKLIYEYGNFRRVIDCRLDTGYDFSKKVFLKNFTVDFLCPVPFWREEHDTKEDIASWIGLLEFPVEIPIEEGMEMGYRQPLLIMNVINYGDVQSGMIIEFRAVGTVKNPSLFNVNTREYMKINYTMSSGDILRVNTHYGQKKVRLLQGTKESNAFRYWDSEGAFLQLDIGDNLFRYDADDNLDGLEVSIYYNNYDLVV